MAKDGVPQEIKVDIDRAFGALTQRFYDFDQSIILGSGIGATPFSGILADLQAREYRQRDSNNPSTSRSESTQKPTAELDPSKYRRVAFHWIVKAEATCSGFLTS